MFFMLFISWVVPVSSNAEDRVQLEIGYMPILPVSQLFVALERGQIKESGINAKLVRFQNGPAMVQALLAGQLDIAYLGIGPTMVARAKGADIKVVAACISKQISFVALGKLAPYFKNGDAGTAFKRFAEENGRKPVIATFPVGSVPETILQYWLRKQLNADPNDLEIVYQGAAILQQSLLTEAVDGAAILEPIVSVVTAKKDDAVVVAKGSELAPNHPGAVLIVREGVIEKHPDIIKALVAAHKSATERLRNAPAEAAVDVQKYVGGGRLDISLVEKAVRNSVDGFIADPALIFEGASAMQDFQAEIGTLKAKVNLDELFEPKFYQAVSGN